MEHYNKEKHYELIKEHMKRASLENRSLDMYPKFENDGDTLFEFIINETDSILIKDREFQELFEDVNGISYYQAMLDYIASVDERSKDQLIINSLEHQDTTSLDNIQCRSFFESNKVSP